MGNLMRLSRGFDPNPGFFAASGARNLKRAAG
jgi:hypothetical protein